MTQQKNEGEGNKTAAKEYNQAQTKFAHSGKVEPAAQQAKKAVESSENAELQKAEEAGRKPARHEKGNADKFTSPPK